MKYMTPYATHLPLLVACVAHTQGPVVEFGSGLYSTPVLHALCQTRELLSVETDPVWFQLTGHFSRGTHSVILVPDFAQAPVDRPWDVALIDQCPPVRRKIDIARLARLARLLVVHDTQNRCYEYEPVLTQFKYRVEWQCYTPWTSVVSNVEPLDWLEDIARG